MAYRKGITIAAAALSFTLVAPAIAPAGYPTVNVALAQEATAPNDVQSASDAIIVADAIANGYINSGIDMTNAAGTVSGRAYMAGYANIGTVASTSSVPVGTTVYLQWKDTDGSVSPIYSAQTHAVSNLGSNQAGPGAYAFDLREGWTDANGKVHTFDAVANEYVRIWIEDFTTESGNRATMQRVAGGLYPGSFSRALASSQGRSMGEFLLAGANLQRTAVWMVEEPVGDYLTRPRDEWIDGTHTGTLTGNRAVSGNVWYETNSYVGVAFNNDGDPSAAGKTVVFSTLTAEGRQAYAAQVESLPELQRAAAAKQLLTDNPQYIDKTVYTTTDAKGDYQLAFPDSWEMDYLYGMLLDTDGTILNTYSSGYTTPEFRRPNANIGYRPEAVPAPLIRAWYNVNFAIAPSNVVELHITNYDATANPASVGDRAEIDLSGAALSPLPNRIVWTDSNGNVVKEITGVTSHADGEARGFLDVPADATDGTIYTVTLYTNDELIAADSFIVQVPGADATDAANNDPAYNPFNATAGKESTVPAPENTDGSDLPTGTTF